MANTAIWTLFCQKDSFKDSKLAQIDFTKNLKCRKILQVPHCVHFYSKSTATKIHNPPCPKPAILH